MNSYNIIDLQNENSKRFDEIYEALKQKNKTFFKDAIYLSSKEVCLLLNISNSTLTKLKQSKKLPVILKGNAVNSPHCYIYNEVKNFFIQLQLHNHIESTL
mgnify:CR=1 FL=1